MRRVKILHLFSDARKTGPADPVIELCRGLQDRGHDVTFAYREHPSGDGRLGPAVAEAGIRGLTDLRLNRYLSPVDTLHDLVALPRLLKRERPDILHTHLSHDHLLGASLARLAKRRPVIVRTLHKRDVLKASLAMRSTLRLADGWITFTETFRQRYIERFNLDEARVMCVPPTIDAEGFDPDLEYKDMRREFGIEPDAPLIGIASRLQPYRRFDIFIEAASMVLKEEPRARFIIVGRSSRIEQSVHEPIRRFGVGEYVKPVGYRTEDYRDTLAAMDVFTLLVAGSDGTARALREAMALGKACVVSDQGMLPDLVSHGKAGMVCQLEPRALASAWLELIGNPQRRAALGRAAREKAISAFQPVRAAELTEAFYERLLTLRASSTSARCKR